MQLFMFYASCFTRSFSPSPPKERPDIPLLQIPADVIGEIQAAAEEVRRFEPEHPAIALVAAADERAAGDRRVPFADVLVDPPPKRVAQPVLRDDHPDADARLDEPPLVPAGIARAE